MNLDRSHERLLRLFERLRKEFDGIDPRTMKPVFVERDPERKRQQKSQFFRKSPK